jgi:hypothetical protein
VIRSRQSPSSSTQLRTGNRNSACRVDDDDACFDGT